MDDLAIININYSTLMSNHHRVIMRDNKMRAYGFEFSTPISKPELANLLRKVAEDLERDD